MPPIRSSFSAAVPLAGAAAILALALPSSAVAVSSPVTSMSTGPLGSCAVVAGGKVKCWGWAYLVLGGKGWPPSGPSVSGYNALAAKLIDGVDHATSVTVGADHACALIDDGSVKCWGKDDKGQLGNGTLDSAFTPVPATGLSDAVAIAAGPFHTCAVIRDGTVKCWGSNDYFATGQPSGPGFRVLVPTTVAHVSGATAIAAGGRLDGVADTCVVTVERKVICWGANDYGQLGGGPLVGGMPTVPTTVKTITDATGIAVGYNHACAVRAAGTVMCWGGGGSGQIGDGSTVNRPSPVPVAGLSSAKSIAAGLGFSCATRTSGTATCWGTNEDGRLGDATSSAGRITPTRNVALSGISRVFASQRHACAIRTDQTIRCWGGGNREFGTLGTGSTYPTSSSKPLQVVGFAGALQVATGDAFACALMIEGSVKCWGSNSDGQLGDGTSDPRPRAGAVTGLSDAVAVTSAGHHACALIRNGTIKCWGRNQHGELGDGTGVSRHAPVTVEGITNAESVSAGLEHSCASLSTGVVKCWGSGYWGQLGAGALNSSATPVEVNSLSGAFGVSAGSINSCALARGPLNYFTTVQCWGNNDWGQISSSGSTESRTPLRQTGFEDLDLNPTTSPNSRPVTVAVGRAHVCAIIRDAGLAVDPSAVMCVGDDWGGELGIGKPAPEQRTPVMVDGINNAVSVAAGDSNTCAVVLDPGVKCWGVNDYGQLGDGSTTDRSRPVSVEGLDSPFQVSITYRHACAVESSGDVKCWGSNLFGELGIGTYGGIGNASKVAGLDSSEPFTSPCLLPVADGTKTGFKARGGWRIRTGAMFWNCGDERPGASILTVQFAVDAAGRPVADKPSDADPKPTSPVYLQGIVGWNAGSDVTRDSGVRPTWVRVGNRVGKWSSWAQIAY